MPRSPAFGRRPRPAHTPSTDPAPARRVERSPLLSVLCRLGLAGLLVALFAAGCAGEVPPPPDAPHDHPPEDGGDVDLDALPPVDDGGAGLQAVEVPDEPTGEPLAEPATP